MSKVFDFIDEYLKVLNDTYGMLKEKTDNLNKELDVSCYKCGNCCKDIRFAVSITEILNIYRYIYNNFTWEDINSVLLKANEYNNSISKALQEKRISEKDLVEGKIKFNETTNSLKLPCFFLKDNKCSIYEARPFICRCFGYSIYLQKKKYIGTANICELTKDIMNKIGEKNIDIDKIIKYDDIFEASKLFSTETMTALYLNKLRDEEYITKTNFYNLFKVQTGIFPIMFLLAFNIIYFDENKLWEF